MELHCIAYSIICMIFPAMVFANWQNINNTMPALALMASNDTFLFANSYSNFYGIFRSSDEGSNWDTLTNNLSKEGGISILISCDNYLYAGTGDSGVFRSSDNGDTWIAVNNGLPSNATISCLIHYDSDLFAGTDSNLYRSTDNGESWVSANNGLPLNSWIVCFAKTDSALFCSTTGGGIYCTMNAGAHWIIISDSIPMLSSNYNYNIVGFGNHLFASNVGTQVSLYVTSDNGAHWHSETSNLPEDFSLFHVANEDSNIFVGSVGIYLTSNYGANWNEIDSGIVSPPSLPLPTALIIYNNYLYVSTTYNGIWRRVHFRI